MSRLGPSRVVELRLLPAPIAREKAGLVLGPALDRLLERPARFSPPFSG